MQPRRHRPSWAGTHNVVLLYLLSFSDAVQHEAHAAAGEGARRCAVWVPLRPWCKGVLHGGAGGGLPARKR